MNRRLQAFTLVELMVVVAIFSVVAAIAIPRFMRHRLQMKQKECEQNLQSFFSAQKSRREKRGSYATSLEDLDWGPKGRGLYRYRFRGEGGRSEFQFECEGNIDRDPSLDRAVIDQTGKIVRESDDSRL